MEVFVTGRYSQDSCYDRAKQVEEFEESKAGVKGLVDSGVAKIPKFFIHRQENIAKQPNSNKLGSVSGLQIPVIDLQGYNDGVRRREIVDELRLAAEKWGFFQMVNHGIPKTALEGLLQGVRRFHELPNEEKFKWYDREPTKIVKFYSNGYLLSSPEVPADWRDSLTCNIRAEQPLDPQELPQVCRQEFLEYLKGIEGLRKLLSEWLSEALGLSSDFIENLNYMKSELFVAHYYPVCPEPDLTLGISKHSDPYVLTLLLQDNVGGLQVLHQDHWIDVPHLEGALIANIGDLMQIISNDKFKSVEHRVVATRGVDSRISAACFFYPSSADNNYKLGPAKELLSEKNPPKYRDIHHGEYMAHWKSTRLDRHSGLHHFKL